MHDKVPNSEEITLELLMHLFFTIPEALQADILCHWLDIETVAVLDSAVCSKLLRPLFLDLLAEKCIFSFIDATRRSPAEWLAERGIQTMHLEYGFEVRWEVSSRWSLFQNSAQSLKVLEIAGPEIESDDEDDPLLLDVAEYCQSITTLFILGEKLTEALDTVIEKCKSLHTLKLEHCTNIKESNIRAICSASNLEQLILSSCSCTIRDSTMRSDTLQILVLVDTHLRGQRLLDVCVCFPKLVHISIHPVSVEDMCLIFSICPLIRSSYIGLVNTFRETHARLLCQNWRQIELLQLQIHGTVPACSEDSVLLLLEGCQHLQKLSVCKLDYPHGRGRLYKNNATGRPITNSVQSNGNNHSNFNQTNNKSSEITDLFLESATYSALSAILALCPKLNTLSVRHPSRYSPSRALTSSSQLAAEYSLFLLSDPMCSVRKLHLQTLSAADLLPLTCLEELLLSSIGPAVDHQAILRFARNNPNLNSISLYECEGLNGQTLIPPLLKACPKLHTLNYHDFGAEEGTRHHTPHPIVAVLKDIVRCCFSHIKTTNIVLKK